MNASVGCKQDLKYVSAKLSVKCKCQRIQKECRSRLTSLTKNVYNEKQVKDEGAVRMSDVYATINYVLVNLINEIWEVEGKAIITDEFKDITNNDMHVIEAIGLGEGNNMSTIAKKLNITVGSLTTAVNSLVKKVMLTGSAAKRIDGSYMSVFWKKGKMHIIITKIIISR